MGTKDAVEECCWNSQEGKQPHRTKSKYHE
jgi:hypothetical protein